MTDKSLPKIDWWVVFNRATPPGSRGWGRVRAAQLLEMARAMQIAAWGMIFNAMLIVLMMAGRAPSNHIALWLVSLALLLQYVSSHRAELQKRIISSVPRKTLNRVA